MIMERLHEDGVMQESMAKLESFPPFKSMAIKVLELTHDWREVRILLPLNGHNANPGGTMFGGAIAALADPIAALACSKHFPDHEIWTKSLTLDFIRPGRTDLQLLFECPANALEEIGVALRERGRTNHTFQYGLHLDDGRLCCRVTCVVAIRQPQEGSDHLGFRKREG